MPRKHPGYLLVIEGTYMCNLACPHCFTGSAGRSCPRAGELTTEEICRLLLDEGKALGILDVVWSGGEFLLRSDHEKLIAEASARGFLNVILTNGKLLTKARLRVLRNAANGSLILGIGLDSVDESTNLATRNQHPSAIFDLLDRCDDLGIGYWVNITVSRDTVPTLEKTIDTLARRGTYFNRVPYAARGLGGAGFERLAFTREDMRDRIHPLLRKHFIGYASFVPFFASPQLVRKNTLRDNPAANFLSFGCYVGASIIVSPTGGVGYCGLIMENVEAGNVRETPLRDIVWGDTFQKHIDRANLKGRCGRCRYRETCGGCRAVAFWNTGDYFAEDPTCFFEPENERTISELEHEMNEKLRRHLAFANTNGEIVIYHQLKKRMPAPLAGYLLKTAGARRILRLKSQWGWSIVPRQEGR